MRRLFAALLLCLAGTAPARAETVVNLYNWSNFMEPAVLEAFRRETGIRVREDVFDSLEVLEGKLSAGRSGYDVIVPSSEPTFARLVRAGALRTLDRERIPNLANLDPRLMERVAAVDPGNRHGAIYLWGTIGLAIRPDRVRALLPGVELAGLDPLLRPELAARLAPCGLAVMDSAADVLPSVLHWLGRPPASGEADDLRAAGAALGAIRPHLRAIPPSGALVDMLATGEICAALTYSGDTMQAATRAREAGRGVEIAYLLPRNGAHLGIDMLAIPADAPNPEAAHRLIDFLLRPENIAAISARVRFPSAVPAARALLPAALRDDADIFPPEAVQRAMYLPPVPDAAAERARARLWSRFRAGRGG